MQMILIVIQIITADFSAALVLIRVIESINELSKTPDLNTLGKIIQVIKNFFTVEQYKK